jgi:hypothetical protein
MTVWRALTSPSHLASISELIHQLHGNRTLRLSWYLSRLLSFVFSIWIPLTSLLEPVRKRDEPWCNISIRHHHQKNFPPHCSVGRCGKTYLAAILRIDFNKVVCIPWEEISEKKPQLVRMTTRTTDWTFEQYNNKKLWFLQKKTLIGCCDCWKHYFLVARVCLIFSCTCFRCEGRAKRQHRSIIVRSYVYIHTPYPPKLALLQRVHTTPLVCMLSTDVS